MSEDWGPWIEHDGRGCPCVGRMVEFVVLDLSGREITGIGIANGDSGSSWFWRRLFFRRLCVDPDVLPIIRYRIRKPRGMVVLETLLADLPEKLDA